MSVEEVTPRVKRSASKGKKANGTKPVTDKKLIVEAGSPHPLGATVDKDGVNFSVFSQNADAVELLLFDEHDDTEPALIIALGTNQHKSFHFWHCYVRGLKPGAHYAYRVDGPFKPEEGHRFNRHKVLIDPYALGNTTTLWSRGSACGDGDNLHTSMRSIVIDPKDYDWEGDRPLRRPMQDTIVYEMHVGGFTRHKNSGAKNPGTFRGIIEKIPYLKSLGVTAVELLPICEFDQNEVGGTNPLTGEPRTNYWGYSTVGFFAPEDAYCVSPEEGQHLTEFRDMVKALHKAGIEVILDVVFNHTSEGNHEGPTFCWKGFDNSLYYHLSPADRRYYMDYTGCGNTVNCNHPIADKFILECLEYWVREGHVDGFRFDEGSILARGEDGVPMAHPPVVWNIELSETLADAKIIAEAWDAAGLYQIGYFPGYRWAEWNGRYRDDIRRFVKGDAGMICAVADRMAGSADIYESNSHLPINSINFVTCHDGFTLYDLVAYNEKHNEANGENNNDGNNDNDSWNCGAEGETDDLNIQALRKRQMKNFCAIQMLSRGVPMISMGDEVGRTQHGNNNAYCQDNEISWFDWSDVKKNDDQLRFFQKMIAFRKCHPVLTQGHFFCGELNKRGLPDVSWHGCELNAPGWKDPACKILACTLGGEEKEVDLHIMLNMDFQDLDFQLPALKDHHWVRAIDTSLPSPEDVADKGKEVAIEGNTYRVNGRSVVVLLSKPTRP